MAEVERLLREFVAELEERGEADPRPYLDRLEGLDRDELEALIDAYLDRAPARDWDPAAFEASSARELTDRLHSSLTGQSGFWPSLLPRLRHRARLRRGEVVERLASELGVAAQGEKVGGYYHRMETGLLPSEGVSDQVLAALAGIYGWSAEALRRAGRPLEPREWKAEAPVFARSQAPAEAIEVESLDRAEPEQWDEVDELFRGTGD
jgi:hypothetical protein